MNKRIIQLDIEQEPDLYKELEYAMLTHTKYLGCYIMQYQEHRGSEGRMVGEFMLREAGGEKVYLKV